MVTLAFFAKAGWAADQSITLRNNAPVYMGPVQEGDLEALTMQDYEDYGLETERPEDQYSQYQKVLGQSASGTQVPYKLKIVDQDLAQEDFFGFGVSEDLAEARYAEYLNMIPATVDGHTIHHVYVYHRPLARTEPEAPEMGE